MLALTPPSRITFLLLVFVFFVVTDVTRAFAPHPPRVQGLVKQRFHNVMMESIIRHVPDNTIGYHSNKNTLLFSSTSDQDKVTTTPSKAKTTRGQLKVAVTEVEIDPITVTAVGLAMMAMTLMFAHFGSGGIAGIVASIMNKWGN